MNDPQNDALTELAYLRQRCDALWSALHERGNPEAQKVAYLEGLLSNLWPRLERLEARIDRLDQMGTDARLARLERQLDSLSGTQSSTAQPALPFQGGPENREEAPELP